VEKAEDEMRMSPVVDMGECTDCGSCLEVCPEVFKRNSETGYIDVIYFHEYPEDCVQEAISVCPADCITWEKS
jgi:ferredoxin